MEIFLIAVVVQVVFAVLMALLLNNTAKRQLARKRSSEHRTLKDHHNPVVIEQLVAYTVEERNRGTHE